ncbi:MAG: RNA polymerase sigma factor [bacterium]
MQAIDREVIKKASEGDIESFEQIYRITSGFVYTVAVRVTNSIEDANDVTQEVFIKVFKNLKSYDYKAALTTWLYRVTVNTALNAVKRISKETSRRVDYDTVLQFKAVNDNSHESAENEDNRALINRLLDKLNPDQRVCVVLREIEGLSYKEIADVLKTNINTVRTRLKRAREALIASQKKEVVQSGV